MNTREAYRGVLSEPDPRSLIAASGASQLGDWLYNAALLGYIYAATGSAAWVGAATVCRLLPYVLFGPIGGVIADRRDKRRVLLAGDGLRCVIMLGLAGVVQFDGHVAVVIVLTSLASVAGTAERPAAMALLPRLVGESRLGPANALLHTVQDLGVVVGPAIGAVLLAVAPASVAFVVNAGTFAVSAFLISMMRPHQPPAASHAEPGFAAHLGEGLRTMLSTAFVVPLFVVVAMVELTYGAQTVQLVVYAEQRLGLGSEGYGYLLAAAGVGGVLSAGLNARLAAGVRVSWVVVGAGGLFCATQIAYAGLDGVVLAVIVTVMGGVGLVACEVVAETALARIVPPEVLGRVMGVFDAASVAAMVLGAVLGSVLIGVGSIRSSLLILGVGAFAVTAACLAALRGLDTLSRQRSEVLASRIGVIGALADRRRGASASWSSVWRLRRSCARCRPVSTW